MVYASWTLALGGWLFMLGIVWKLSRGMEKELKDGGVK